MAGGCGFHTHTADCLVHVPLTVSELSVVAAASASAPHTAPPLCAKNSNGGGEGHEAGAQAGRRAEKCRQEGARRRHCRRAGDGLADVRAHFMCRSCAVDAHDDQSTTSTSTGRRRARRWPICSQSFGIEALDCTRMAASAASTPGSVWRCCRRRCHGSRFGSRASVTQPL